MFYLAYTPVGHLADFFPEGASLDGNSEHASQTWRKIVTYGKNNQVNDCTWSNQKP